MPFLGAAFLVYLKMVLTFLIHIRFGQVKKQIDSAERALFNGAIFIQIQWIPKMSYVNLATAP